MHDYKTVVAIRQCRIEPSWEPKIIFINIFFIQIFINIFQISNIFKLYWSDIPGFNIRFWKWKKYNSVELLKWIDFLDFCIRILLHISIGSNFSIISQYCSIFAIFVENSLLTVGISKHTNTKHTANLRCLGSIAKFLALIESA